MDMLWLSHLVPYPPKSGALLRSYYLLRAAAARHNVDLVAFIQEPLLANFYSSLDDALHDCERHLKPMCRTVKLLPIAKLQRSFGQYRTAAESLFARYGYVANWLRSTAATAALRDLTSRQQYDVAHFDYEGLACYRYLLGKTPTSLGHHNAEAHMMQRRAANESRRLQKLYFGLEARKLARFEQHIARQFALHITCSELDSARVHSTMPDARLASVPNGVDVQYFQSQQPTTIQDSMVFVSSMNWYPNVDAALFLLREIWPIVKKARPHARLDIIGAKAPPSVISSARDQPGVTVHGYVPDIRPIVDAAAVYICPVRDGGGTKLKILDALAMGKAIVAHPVACEGIRVTDGTDVLLAGTAAEFAKNTLRLFDSADTRTRLGKSARELAVKSYSFDALGREFVSLLESMKH